MNLGPEELLDYKLMPRLPMCYWDFDQEKMYTVDEDLTLSAKDKESKSKDASEAQFFYAVHPRRSIDELERKVERRKDRYARRVRLVTSGWSSVFFCCTAPPRADFFI